MKNEVILLTVWMKKVVGKKSLITIFGHKHKIKNFNSLRFWFIFGIKWQILNQNYIKMIIEF